jgi:hypothetical protein
MQEGVRVADKKSLATAFLLSQSGFPVNLKNAFQRADLKPFMSSQIGVWRQVGRSRHSSQTVEKTASAKTRPSANALR